MAQLADFISRIFSSGRTQGLSGGAEVLVDADPASAFYLSRLRKHSAESDLVADPLHLWNTTSYSNRRGGLRAHVQAERGEGIASFTDVLLVISQPDARRAAQEPGWTDRVARILGEQFTEFCVSEKFELLYGTRPLRFFIVADGGKEMLNQKFDLEPGEFVTGLLPNLYVGPARRSRPVLAVHMNLPGAWEGYREVARLYSDQIVLTLGRHWLDNFNHPGLKEPGLYRLQQYPDGSLVHVISPELQDRYYVRSDQTDAGPSVLTIAETSGRPVAFVVLAVIESGTVEIPAPDELLEAAATPVQMQFVDGGGPDIGVSSSIDRLSAPAEPAIALPNLRATTTGGLSGRQRTIVPDAFDARILTLQEKGALLQKVHFSNFMEGYDVYLGPKAQIATSNTAPRAVIQVRFGRVTLLAKEAGVKLDRRALDPGQPILLKGKVEIEIDGVKVEYRDLTAVKAEGWPYLGELRRPGGGAYLDFGAAYQIGRDRRSKVRLPDEPHNENIAWLPSVGGGATIRSRTGDIPKSRFYTDSIMVAATHAEVDLANEPVLRSLARHCYTYVRRGDEVIALFPREGAGGRHESPLQVGDEVLVGNCLFHAGFPPAAPGSGASLPPKEMPKFTAGELASIADGVVATGPAAGPGTAAAPGPRPAAGSGPVVPPSAPAAPPRQKALPTVDPVAPGGFGGTGPAPRPPSLTAQKSPSASGGMRKRNGKTTFSDIPDGSEPPSLSAVVSAALDVPERGRPPAPVRIDAGGTDSGIISSAAARPAGARLAIGGGAPSPLDDAATSIDAPPPPARGGKAKPADRAPPPPPPMLLDESDLDQVSSVEEKQWQLELSRPARLIQVGWSVNGEFSIGNHRGVEMVVPEVKLFAEQAFMTLDYVRIYARGKKGRIELVQEGEASVIVGGGKVRSTDNVKDAEIQIIRRDANLEPDFEISLRFAENPGLPDPRAQLLKIDVSDRLVAALFTRGFPLRTSRTLGIGPITMTVQFDGEQLRVSDYLTSYRTGATGFMPFFYRQGERPWRTAPEDGSPFTLAPGDGLLCGTSLHRFEAS